VDPVQRLLGDTTRPTVVFLALREIARLLGETAGTEVTAIGHSGAALGLHVDSNRPALVRCDNAATDTDIRLDVRSRHAIGLGTRCLSTGGRKGRKWQCYLPWAPHGLLGLRNNRSRQLRRQQESRFLVGSQLCLQLGDTGTECGVLCRQVVKCGLKHGQVERDVGNAHLVFFVRKGD
jgi:hypothetical protein